MKTSHVPSVLSALLAAVSICPTAALADPALPAATSQVSCSDSNGSVSDTASCALAHSSGSATLSPTASLTGSAAFVGGDPASAGVFAVLDYNFEVVGGTQDTVVPVDVDAILQQMTVNSNSPAYAFSEIIVNTARSSTSMAICSFGCATSATSFDGTLNVDVLADEPGENTIGLEIDVQAAGYASIQANSAFASADPLIYVDPGFANAGAYRIVLSAGVGNGTGTGVSPVPEPGLLALMLGGLAFTGFGVNASRRRRVG